MVPKSLVLAKIIKKTPNFHFDMCQMKLTITLIIIETKVKDKNIK